MPNVTKPVQKKKKGHFGKGLIAGAIFGIAAGIYMSSKEGRAIASKVKNRATDIEKRLRAEFSKNKDMTEDAYGQSIDSVLAYYERSKKIAKSEIPELKRYLLGKWKTVKNEMREVGQEQKEEERARVASKKKKVTKKK